MRPENGLVIAGRYRLEEPLAAGGMGALWVATHLQLDIRVAVKFMADELDDTGTGRARFEREAKAAAKMQSPHVVRTYDYGVEGGTPYIAMELLLGESLESRLKRERTLSGEDAARIATQVGKGLREAHELGIVHRDLKPANIFLARVGDEEVAKILDFGIAKETKDVIVGEHTKSGTVIGSPHHMSPEQARGAVVDTRSDLWSFAVVLFRVLTGEKPFPGTNMGDVIARICGDAIPKPSNVAPWLGPEIDAFFEHALRRSPDLRFQSVRELVAAFDEAVGRLPRGADAARDPRPTTDTVVARTEATRAVPARTSIADIESTAVATASDQPAHRPKDRRWTRTALGAGVLVVVAGAMVFSWLRFGPHETEPTLAASQQKDSPSDAATASAAADVSPAISPSAVASAVVTPVASAASPIATASASARLPWRAPQSKFPPPKQASGSPFF